MKRWSWMSALLCLVMAAPAFAATGNISLLFGEKQLDSSDWDPAFTQQDEFGLMFDVTDRYWPISLAVDLLGSSHKINYLDGYTQVSTGELDLGVRQHFDIYGTDLHPYLGGGLALVSARVEDVYYFGSPCGAYDCGDEDGAIGIWLNGGIYWTLGNMLNLGLDLRYSAADVSLYNGQSGRYETVDAGGVHSGITLGLHW